LSASQYLQAVRDITHHIEETQLDSIGRAADIVIESITHGGVVYCAEIGHGNQYDFLNRAGGLAAVQHFSYSYNVNSPTPACLANRPREEMIEVDLENARHAVRTSNLRKGDVLIVSSVSGKGRNPIELALAARQIGVQVIGLTSVEYTSQVISSHTSGKRLIEVVDIAIDIGAPYGDAVIEMAGFDQKVMPISGVSMICIGWMLWGTVMERMAASGNPPTVYTSVNREGGQAFYETSRKQYEDRGY